MEVRNAKLEDLAAINQLIAASKRYWNYAEDYLAAAIPLIQIDAQWLGKHRGFALFDQELVGFLGIEIEEDHWHLEHLWIAPEFIKAGYGRQAIEFMKDLARQDSVALISLFPDPPAEGFYQKLGAEYSGKIVPSRISGGPTFHEMRFHIPS